MPNLELLELHTARIASMSAFARFTTSLFLVVASVLQGVQVQEKIKPLSADDEKLLQGLLRDFLLDPKGAERVEAQVRERSVWGEGSVKTQGWLVKSKSNEHVYFNDGAKAFAAVQKKIDFVAQCKNLPRRTPTRRAFSFRSCAAMLSARRMHRT
jgi:hypothetical protein